MTTAPSLSPANPALASIVARRGRLAACLDAALGHSGQPLTLEAKLRRALRAAKFEETPPAVWRKVLPTIPEGVSTTQADEMFAWARSLILDSERATGISELQARRNTAQRLLSTNGE